MAMTSRYWVAWLAAVCIVMRGDSLTAEQLPPHSQPTRVRVALSALIAQSSASFRWLTAIDRARDGESAGEHIMFGEQREWVFRIAATNFEGPQVVGVDSLPEQVRVLVERAGRKVDTEAESVFTRLSNGPLLAPGETVELQVTVRTSDGTPFSIGQYLVTVDLVDFLNGLRFEDGRKWSGRSKEVESRRILIKRVNTTDDRIAFYDLEANYLFGTRRYAEAIPYFEQLVALRPTAWQPNAALGAAYIQLKRYGEAIAPLERALPGWLRLAERRGDIVPNSLARAYLALNNAAEAVRVLRTAGLAERDIPERVNQLRATVIR